MEAVWQILFLMALCGVFFSVIYCGATLLGNVIRAIEQYFDK